MALARTNSDEYDDNEYDCNQGSAKAEMEMEWQR